MKAVLTSLALALTVASTGKTTAAPVPPSFASTGADRNAIQTLLDAYSQAVSKKDQVQFESLLLNKEIPFSDVSSAIHAKGAVGGERKYDDFRRGVFEGPAFTQRFEKVRVEQDGPLADVSLVFINTSAEGSSWGWKALQLLKVDGHWKIASEFYTGHPG